MAEDAKKNIYLNLHKAFVRENIEYTDKRTGEKKTFNQVTLHKGTVIDGIDVGGYEFSPLFVNESRYRGSDWRDVPLIQDKEVWLQKSVLDVEGNPVIGEDGKRQKDTVKVMPAEIKEALDAARRAYAEEHGGKGLEERAADARQGSDALGRGDAAREHESTRE